MVKVSVMLKLDVRKNYPKLKTITDLIRFFEIFNFYKCFLEKETEILQALKSLLKGQLKKNAKKMCLPHTE